MLQALTHAHTHALTTHTNNNTYTLTHTHTHTHTQIYPYETVDPMGLDGGRIIYEWLGQHLARMVDGAIDAADNP